MLTSFWIHCCPKKDDPCTTRPQRSLRWNGRDGAYFSSSSSMKPLLSWSMTAKAFLMSSGVLAARPTLAKNSLCLKESAALRRQRRDHIRRCRYVPHKLKCVLQLHWFSFTRPGRWLLLDPQPLLWLSFGILAWFTIRIHTFCKDYRNYI